MSVRRIGKHDARDERAKRRRQMQRVHERGTGKDCEQPNAHKQFPLPQSPDKTQDGVENVAPDKNKADDGTNCEKAQLPSRRRRQILRGAGQSGNDRDQRHNRKVLK